MSQEDNRSQAEWLVENVLKEPLILAVEDGIERKTSTVTSLSPKDANGNQMFMLLTSEPDVRNRIIEVLVAEFGGTYVLESEALG